MWELLIMYVELNILDMLGSKIQSPRGGPFRDFYFFLSRNLSSSWPGLPRISKERNPCQLFPCLWETASSKMWING